MAGTALPGWRDIDKLKNDYAPLFGTRQREEIKAQFVHMKKNRSLDFRMNFLVINVAIALLLLSYSSQIIITVVSLMTLTSC
jgi:hypothetical protein